MAESGGRYKKLPPGWDCKYDKATGNRYYINYFTKVMQLEDPRLHYKPLQDEKCSTESIPLAPLHGSPYHVYPGNNYPALRAFQSTPNNQDMRNMSSSPLLSSRSNLEMSPLPFSGKSVTSQIPRLANTSRRSTIQETSFSNNIDTDAVVAKIQNMFPTAGENHIRLLLKRYMKTIFPKADETLLLDVLANSDNNVQSASEKLIVLGYVKRDFVAPKVSNRQEAEADADKSKKDDVIIIPLRPKDYTEEEKEAMRIRLKQKYDKTAERIILMALESVNYAEDRAMQILQIVQEEDETRERKTHELSRTNKQHSATAAGTATTKVTDGSEERYTSRSSTESDVKCHPQPEFKSMLGRIPPKGHNSELSKGADDGLLLVDYVTWNGANPDISMGQKPIAIGADAGLLSERSYVAVGHNSGLCKGPQSGLAKGSIYSQLTTAVSNIKCK